MTTVHAFDFDNALMSFDKLLLAASHGDVLAR